MRVIQFSCLAVDRTTTGNNIQGDIGNITNNTTGTQFKTYIVPLFRQRVMKSHDILGRECDPITYKKDILII